MDATSPSPASSVRWRGRRRCTGTRASRFGLSPGATSIQRGSGVGLCSRPGARGDRHRRRSDPHEPPTRPSPTIPVPLSRHHRRGRAQGPHQHIACRTPCVRFDGVADNGPHDDHGFIWVTAGRPARLQRLCPSRPARVHMPKTCAAIGLRAIAVVAAARDAWLQPRRHEKPRIRAVIPRRMGSSRPATSPASARRAPGPASSCRTAHHVYSLLCTPLSPAPSLAATSKSRGARHLPRRGRLRRWPARHRRARRQRWRRQSPPSP